MHMKNVLIIEDDPDIGNLIRKTLSLPQYNTALKKTGQSGLNHYRENKPDLVILDLSLPDIDGLDICKDIRKEDDLIPIFILSARIEEIDRIMGLELGADDYITKPFSVRELKTKVDVFFRRWEPRKEFTTETIKRGKMVIDLEKRILTINDKKVNISRKEFDILSLLAETPGVVMSREEILNHIWGEQEPGYERMVDSHIKRLRSKIEKSPTSPKWIETLWGVGYKFTENYENI